MPRHSRSFWMVWPPVKLTLDCRFLLQIQQCFSIPTFSATEWKQTKERSSTVWVLQHQVMLQDLKWLLLMRRYRIIAAVPHRTAVIVNQSVLQISKPLHPVNRKSLEMRPFLEMEDIAACVTSPLIAEALSRFTSESILVCELTLLKDACLYVVIMTTFHGGKELMTVICFVNTLKYPVKKIYCSLEGLQKLGHVRDLNRRSWDIFGILTSFGARKSYVHVIVLPTWSVSLIKFNILLNKIS